ncbi:MAG TPA: type II CAAX endopeptidase family protein [Candidatus Acidoferrales bacterium]|nr:type II CAAX endopeptidase family protein [Candidatus Acidoferrales bacterium]
MSDAKPPVPGALPDDAGRQTSEPARPRRWLPEDVQTAWGWKELVLFLVVGFASLILLTDAMAGLAVVWLKVKPADLKTFVTTDAVFLSLRQAAWYVVVILYLYATIRLSSRAPFWQTIGWRRLRPGARPEAMMVLLCLVSGVALGVVAELGSFAFRTKAKLPIEALFHDRRGVIWLMAIGILLAPVVEETIFRGFLYPVLARSLGVEGGIVATGVLFGMLHAPQLWRGWGEIGLLVLVGIVLTYARERSGTVLASWLLHLGYNTYLFAGFFLSTAGLRHLPPGG